MKVYEKVKDQIGNFSKTKKRITVTYSGWDGKSYNGEGKTTNVWVNPNFPGAEFVFCRKSFESFNNGKYKVDCFHKVTDELHEVSGIRKVEYFDSIEVPYEIV